MIPPASILLALTLSPAGLATAPAPGLTPGSTPGLSLAYTGQPAVVFHDPAPAPGAPVPVPPAGEPAPVPPPLPPVPPQHDPCPACGRG